MRCRITIKWFIWYLHTWFAILNPIVFAIVQITVRNCLWNSMLLDTKLLWLSIITKLEHIMLCTLVLYYTSLFDKYIYIYIYMYLHIKIVIIVFLNFRSGNLPFKYHNIFVTLVLILSDISTYLKCPSI